MCSDIPDNTLDPYEALEVAKDKGWVPVVTILGKLGWHDGKPTVNTKRLHYLWGLDEETATMVALSFIAEMRLVMIEEGMRRAREN